MRELPTAEEARSRVELMIYERANKVKAEAIRRIMDAIEEGNTQVSLDVEFRYHGPLKEFLTSKGYAVHAGSSQRDGAYFEVTW